MILHFDAIALSGLIPRIVMPASIGVTVGCLRRLDNDFAATTPAITLKSPIKEVIVTMSLQSTLILFHPSY